MEATMEHRQAGHNPLPAIFLVALIFVAGLLLVSQVSTPATKTKTVPPKEVTNPNDAHAVERHGADAVLVEQKCQQNGVYTVYREGKDIFHQLCQMGNGSYGDWIIRKVGDHYETVTKLIPKDGSWTEIIKWLARKQASRYTGPF